jgi:hypothetical protein
VSRVRNGHHLVEGFVPADHAEISTSALFGRITTLFQIDDFGVERSVAYPLLIFVIALLGNGFAELLVLTIAVMGKPKRALTG